MRKKFYFQDEGVSLSATPGSSLDGGARPEVAADFQRDSNNGGGGDDGGETVSMESHNNRQAAGQPPQGRRRSPSLDEEEVGFPRTQNSNRILHENTFEIRPIFNNFNS
jgi:hypothetical protein